MAEEKRTISYEEAVSLAPPRREAAPGTISYEEAIGLSRQPEGRPGPLANAPTDTTASRVAKNLATGALKGLSAVPGMFGDIRALGDAAYAGIMSSPRMLGINVTPYEERLANIRRGQGVAAEALGGIDLAASPPTTAEIQDMVLSRTGEYKPESLPGRMAQGALELGVPAAGPMAGIGMARGAAGSGADIARDVISGLSAGAGGELAGYFSGDSPLAKFAGQVAGAFTPSAARAGLNAVRPLVMPEQSARGVAGTVLRESAQDPEAAIRALQAGSPEATAMGVSPTTRQLAGDPGLDALERAARSQDPTLAAGLNAAAQENAARVAATAEAMGVPGASGEAARTVARDAATQAQTALESGLPGVSRMDASTAARRVFEEAMDAAKKETDVAWQAVRDSNGALFFNNVQREIDQRLRQSLRPGQLKDVKPIIDRHLAALREAGVGRDVPVDMINDIRSELLDKAKAAGKAGETDLARRFSAGADAVLDAVSNKANWRFGDDSTVKLWEEARRLSRDYHQTFRDDVLRPLSQETSAGLEKVAEGATLRRLLSGDPAQAARNVEQFLVATRGAGSSDVRNFLFAKLTGDGGRRVTEGSLTKFMAENGPIIDAVPGARDQFDKLLDAAKRHGSLTSNVGYLMFEGRDPAAAANFLIGQKDAGARAREVLDFGQRMIGGADGRAYVDGVRQAVLDRMTGDPTKIGDFLGKNSALMANLFPDAAQREVINRIQTVDRMISRAPAQTFSNLRAYEDLTGGRVLDLLVGAAQGKIMSAGAGAIAGTALAKAGIPDVGVALELVGAALGLGAQGGIGRTLYGGVADRANQIISEALRDPTKAAILMKKSTPATWNQFGRSAPETLARAGGIEAGRAQQLPPE